MINAILLEDPDAFAEFLRYQKSDRYDRYLLRKKTERKKPK